MVCFYVCSILYFDRVLDWRLVEWVTKILKGHLQRRRLWHLIAVLPLHAVTYDWKISSLRIKTRQQHPHARILVDQLSEYSCLRVAYDEIIQKSFKLNRTIQLISPMLDFLFMICLMWIHCLSNNTNKIDSSINHFFFLFIIIRFY